MLLDDCTVAPNPVGTLGGVVSVGGLTVVTVIVAVAEVVLAPRLSIATALKAWLPAVALLHVTAYGEVASTPSEAVPRKNSTLAMLPSLSLALAVTAMLLPAL